MTEPTIDEQIRLKLLSLINNLQDVWLEDKDSWYGAETTVPEILALISDQVAKARIVTGETSDGYHTFNELYEYRKLYNALLFNEWYQTKNYGIHKSKRHNDGNLCFGGGWFVVAAELPTGQVTNHYELKDWGLFKVEERHKAVKYDGHTPQEAAERLRATLKGVKT